MRGDREHELALVYFDTEHAVFVGPGPTQLVIRFDEWADLGYPDDLTIKVNP